MSLFSPWPPISHNIHKVKNSERIHQTNDEDENETGNEEWEGDFYEYLPLAPSIRAASEGSPGVAWRLVYRTKKTKGT